MELEYKTAFNSITFTPRQAAMVSHAVADVLCWLNGFRAAGGDYASGLDLETLRDLNRALKGLRWSHDEEEAV